MSPGSPGFMSTSGFLYFYRGNFLKLSVLPGNFVLQDILSGNAKACSDFKDSAVSLKGSDGGC